MDGIARKALVGAFAIASLAACAGSPGAADEPRARAQETTARALPLHRFRWSRSAQTDAQGFYFQPAGLCDDYPEETTTLAKIARDFDAITATGAKVFRFGIGWDAIETAKGQYDFLFWDDVVAAAERAGVELIPYVAYTPRWAAAAEDDFYRRPPRDLDAFGRFMHVIASRYRGRIRSWELWNEPDLEAYWLGDADAYARMVKHAAREVRRADPEAVVVLGGVAHGRGPFFDALVTEHRLDGFVDVVNLHGYLETWGQERAERSPERIEAMAALLPRRPRGPDLWMAELGYADYRFAADEASSFGIDVVYAYEHTAEYQAVALFKHHVLALVPEELSLTAWYRVNDLPRGEPVIGDDANKFLGILDERGAPKPAFHALRLFTTLFDRPARLADGRARVERGPASQSVVHVFEEDDGGALVVGWLRSSTREEVGDRSGLAIDARRESVAVRLPSSRLARLTEYDVRGRAIEPSTATLVDGVLRGVRLTGDSVFIAELRP